MKRNPDFCCACGQSKTALNLITLHQKAPTPGKGWGCAQCHLPSDGAIAAICDGCLRARAPLRFVFDGYVLDGKVIPIEELPNIPHNHNEALHPELEKKVKGR